MSCVCKLELEASVQAWASLPLPSLTAKVPGIAVGGLVGASVGLMSAVGLSGQAGAGASALATASATANASALLGAYAALGIDPFSADASAQMSLAIQSMNLHLPWVLGELSAAFDGHVDALMTLNAALSASLLVEALFGFPLTTVGVGAKLQAALAAGIGVSASALASASASAQLSATASGLGLDLSLPGGQADFAAALSAAAGFGASLALPIGSLGLVASVVAQIQALAKLGIDLHGPDAEIQIGLGLPALFAGVEALLALDASAYASAQASAQAEADASADADLGLGLDLNLPDLGALSLAASLTAQLGLGASLALGSPCSVCPLQAQLVA